MIVLKFGGLRIECDTMYDSERVFDWEVKRAKKEEERKKHKKRENNTEETK